MKPEAPGYILKEYGSWSVLITSFLVGTVVSHTFSPALIPLFAALAFLINSKQALMAWRRRKDRIALLFFLGQVIAAAAILFAIFREDVPMLLPLLIFPAAYLAANALTGEHSLLTELLGFVLISLAAVLAKFLLSGGLDVRLFLGVALYFTAGVFKVRALLRKGTGTRISAVIHVLVSAYVYHRMYIPLIILLPLVENLLAAATLYKVRLKTTGWIEVAKGLVFLGLFSRYF